MKNVEHLSPKELCAEAERIQKDIRDLAVNLNDLYIVLYSKVRRSPSSALTPAYLSIASAGKRFAGVVIQAVARTSSIGSRALQIANREASDQERYQELAKKKKEQQEKKKRLESLAKPMDPLAYLFGVPLTRETVVPEIDSIKQALGDGTSDLDSLYGEGS